MFPMMKDLLRNSTIVSPQFISTDLVGYINSCFWYCLPFHLVYISWTQLNHVIYWLFSPYVNKSVAIFIQILDSFAIFHLLFERKWFSIPCRASLMQQMPFTVVCPRMSIPLSQIWVKTLPCKDSYLQDIFIQHLDILSNSTIAYSFIGEL